jgi:predicted phosphodiesterase
MRKMVRVIGDIHGKLDSYFSRIEAVEHSIQIGDFGMGFFEEGELPEMPPGHRFIRGNHDSPELCKQHPNWIPDGTVENDVMFIGGAWSIDWKWRTPGVSWWEDEECSDEQFEQMIKTYEAVKPRVMITHDAPMSAILKFFNPYSYYEARTQTYFDQMLQIHQPQVWIFGHWHKDVMGVHMNTAFICLNELSYVDIEL